MQAILVEVVAYNLQSVTSAVNGGADRIELCVSPEDGGTTPSYGIIEQARKLCPLDLFVMIRPRSGDFLYAIHEFNAMKSDIAQCKLLGVDGVVFGILKADGTVDKQRCKELIELSRPLKVTCHRAFDMTPDPFQALEDCIELGFDRILTSGHKAKAIDGADLIGELIQQAAGRISIMPGAGITETNVLSLVKKTNAFEIHLSASNYVESKMDYLNPDINTMGGSAASLHQIKSVDEGMLRRIRALLK